MATGTPRARTGARPQKSAYATNHRSTIGDRRRHSESRRSTGRLPGLVGDPALCWNSTNRRESVEPARRGATQRRAAVEGRAAPVTHDHPGRARPPRRDTVPPLRAGDAWSRGCDASAGTFQEGWRRCGRPGAARRDRPRLLAPARPDAPDAAAPGDGGGRPDGPRHAGSRPPSGRAGSPPSPRVRASTRLANSAAQLAHQHPAGLAARPAGGRRRPPWAACASTSSLDDIQPAATT